MADQAETPFEEKSETRAEPADASRVARGPDPAATADGVRRPLVALTLSAILPGLGQIYNRQLLSGIGLAAVTALLFHAAFTDPRLAGFVAAVWLYQAIEAWTDAAGTVASAAAPTRSSTWWSWGLIGGGSILLLETNTGAILPRPTVLVPLLLIAGGLRLLYTYFRSAKETS